MSMEGRYVKPGQVVTIDGCKASDEGFWEVLDRAPRPAHWWLHRYTNGVWETTTAHTRNMSFALDPYRPASHLAKTLEEATNV